MNMVKIRTSLLAGFRSGVMPVDRPTVPKAETSSNKSWRKEQSGSKMQSKKVPQHTTKRDKSAIMEDLDMDSVGRER